MRDARLDLIAQMESFLSGGTTLDKFTAWMTSQTYDGNNQIAKNVLSDLGGIATGEMTEKGIRKSWKRMLNQEKWGRK